MTSGSDVARKRCGVQRVRARVRTKREDARSSIGQLRQRRQGFLYEHESESDGSDGGHAGAHADELPQQCVDAFGVFDVWEMPALWYPYQLGLRDERL